MPSDQGWDKHRLRFIKYSKRIPGGIAISAVNLFLGGSGVAKNIFLSVCQ